MQYPIFIHKNENSAYGVIVPDLPGCYSLGDTIEETIENSHEAIECHIEQLSLKRLRFSGLAPFQSHKKTYNYRLE